MSPTTAQASIVAIEKSTEGSRVLRSDSSPCSDDDSRASIVARKLA